MKVEKYAAISINVWEEPSLNGKRAVLVSINNQHGTWWTGSQEEFAQLFLGCREVLSPVVKERLPYLLQDLYTLAKRGRSANRKPAKRELHAGSLKTLWGILQA